MKRSFLIALALALGAVGWVVSGQFGDGERRAEAQKPPAELAAVEYVPQVRVRTQEAQPHTTEVVLRGRTEALRTVDVRAETHGRVVELLVERGGRVTQGQLLLRLAPESRPELVKEAEALLDQRRIEFEAARRLSEKGFRAETQLAAAKAALDAAEAALSRARVELGNTRLTAPFDGIIDDRMVDLGDYVDTGDPVARVVDLDPILIVAEVSERDIGRIEVGGAGQARLVTGPEVAGSVRFVAAMANAQTRTFRVELEVPNPDGAIPDGLTAELTLPLEEVPAHFVSPAILTLSDEGVVGVMTLDAENRARFVAVQIVDTRADGVWLTGLPQRVTFIVVGQEYVVDGQTVAPVEEGTLQPVPAGEVS